MVGARVAEVRTSSIRVMGLIIGSKLRDDFAVETNGVDSYAWTSGHLQGGTPTAGAYVADVWFDAALGANGSLNIATTRNNDTTPGNNFTLMFMRQDTAFGNTGMHVGIQSWDSGANDWVRGGAASVLLPQTWYRVVAQSNGEIWIDGISQTVVRQASPGRPDWTGQWGTLRSGLSPSATAIGAARLPNGSTMGFAAIGINNFLSINRPLTPDEVAEDFNGGIRLAYQKMSFASDIIHAYDYEQNLLDRVGTQHFTGVNGPTFVAP